MKELGIFALAISLLTIFTMIKDRKRQAKFEAWKKENDLTDEECGL